MLFILKSMRTRADLAPVTRLLQPANTIHQARRLWFGMSREANGVHVHPVAILPITRGAARIAL